MLKATIIVFALLFFAAITTLMFEYGTELQVILYIIINSGIIFGFFWIKSYNKRKRERKSDKTSKEMKTIEFSDPLVRDALFYIYNTGQGSVSGIQRKFRVGYATGNKVFNELIDLGFIKMYNNTIAVPTLQINELKNKYQLTVSQSATDEQNFLKSRSNDNEEELNLESIDRMSSNGLEFESFSARLLIANGFTNVRKTQGSGDYGVDVLAEKDGVTYAIQCKCYSDKVGNKAVQEAYSGKNYYKCMVAAVLTNNYFTRAAIETAEANQVLLWDREKLKEFLKAYSSLKDKPSDNTKELFTAMLREISYKIVDVLSKNGTECRIKDIFPELSGILYEFYADEIPNHSIAKIIADSVSSPNVHFCESDDPEIIKLFLEYPESMRILRNNRLGIK